MSGFDMTNSPQTTTSDLDWTSLLIEQFQWHWQQQARPRLEGLSDEEYFWEPVQPAWNVRRRSEVRAQDAAPIMAGTGDFSIDFAMEVLEPPPMTTIAWRLGHVIVGILGERNAAHFGGPTINYPSFAYAGTAGEALAQLDAGVDRWLCGVEGSSVADLAQPCGETEGPFATASMATLVLHINRELIHHLAEIALLRDLWAHRD